MLLDLHFTCGPMENHVVNEDCEIKIKGRKYYNNNEIHDLKFLGATAVLSDLFDFLKILKIFYVLKLL